MATIAVFMVLGGGAYAAGALPSNSVGTKQIKKHAVTLSKISDSAQKALRGHNGIAGVSGYQVVSSSPRVSFTGSTSRGAVDCPAGTKALGGGANTAGGPDVSINSSHPSDSGDGWVVFMSNTGSTATFTVYATCATVAPGH